MNEKLKALTSLRENLIDNLFAGHLSKQSEDHTFEAIETINKTIRRLFVESGRNILKRRKT